MNMYTLYEIVHRASGRKYIGVTCRDLNVRWNEHCSASSGCHKLRNAIQKYGKESFYIKALVKGSRDYIEALEVSVIKLYKTQEAVYGFNIEGGGNLQKHISQSTREKISKANKGKKRSEEVIAKIKENSSGENNGMYGKSHTEASKEKISKSNKGLNTGINNHKSIPVKVFGSEYTTLAEAIRLLKTDLSKWPYDMVEGIREYSLPEKFSKPVKIEDKIFDSLWDAGQKLDIPLSALVRRVTSANFKSYSYLN